MTNHIEKGLSSTIDRLYVINLKAAPTAAAKCWPNWPGSDLMPQAGWWNSVAVKPDTAGTFPSIGARGVFSAIWGVAKGPGRKAPRLLILEDDAAITPECAMKLGAALDEFTTDRALAYLGHPIAPDRIPQTALAQQNPGADCQRRQGLKPPMPC